jgi:hypothetical protein
VRETCSREERPTGDGGHVMPLSVSTRTYSRPILLSPHSAGRRRVRQHCMSRKRLSLTCLGTAGQLGDGFSRTANGSGGIDLKNLEGAWFLFRREDPGLPCHVSGARDQPAPASSSCASTRETSNCPNPTKTALQRSLATRRGSSRALGRC